MSAFQPSHGNSAFQPSHGNSAFQPSPGNCFVVISFLSANDVKCTNSIFLCLPIVYHIHVSVICHHFCSCSDRLRRITHLQSFWFSHYTMHSFLSLFWARDYVLEIVRTADSHLPGLDWNVMVYITHELYWADCCETQKSRRQREYGLFSNLLKCYSQLNLGQLQYVYFSFLVLLCGLTMNSEWSLCDFQRRALPSNAFLS